VKNEAIQAASSAGHKPISEKTEKGHQQHQKVSFSLNLKFKLLKDFGTIFNQLLI